MKLIADEVERKLNSQPFVTIEDAKKAIENSSSGFYWIFTSLSYVDFQKASPPENIAHVDYSEMARVHKGLKHVIQSSEKDYWCIYNGKARQLKNRMYAAFTVTNGGTGKLSLERCFKKEDFKVKYIICDSDDPLYGIKYKYSGIEQNLERVWRLNYGWPLLCRT